MLTKQLDNLKSSDFQALIDDGVAERKTLDYKRDLPGNSDADTKEFLADVSSLANTAGGDLIFGMEAPSGIGEPTEVVGVSSASIETEKLRLDGKIQSGISPRLPRYDVKEIPITQGRVVLVLRVPQSWNGPHRVIAKGHGHFYGRNSSGKYQLDVEQLRRAFTLSESMAEQLRAFQAQRIFLANRNELPTPIDNGPRLLTQVVPFETFSPFSQVDISGKLSEAFSLSEPYGLRYFEPFSHTGSWDSRVNLDGRLIFPTAAGGRPAGRSYIQLFRRGFIETVWALPTRNEHRLILCDEWVNRFLQLIPRYIQGVEKLGLQPPMSMFVTLLNAKGYELVHNRFHNTKTALNTPEIIFPEIRLETSDQDIAPAFSSLLDILWNACGVEANPYFSATK